MPLDQQALAQFLIEAKTATYASGQNKATATRPGSTDYHYEKSEWAYHDCYWGAGQFIGHEIVWCAGQPVWGMNYYGGPVDSAVDTAPAYTFLKSALLALDSSIIPVRGPAKFIHSDYSYTNIVTGDLTKFEGTEEIAKSGATICRHIYHGGLIL